MWLLIEHDSGLSQQVEYAELISYSEVSGFSRQDFNTLPLATPLACKYLWLFEGSPRSISQATGLTPCQPQLSVLHAESSDCICRGPVSARLLPGQHPFHFQQHSYDSGSNSRRNSSAPQPSAAASAWWLVTNTSSRSLQA